MTRHAEVIGDPIDHSLSPVIHRFWLDALGIAGDYRRRQVTRATLADYLADARADPDWLGCNVTMPLKLDALAAADQASDRAIAAGAANILLSRDGQLHAGNTDVAAMARTLEKLRDDGRALGRVLILGNGGAARSALVALRLVGAKAVEIHARDLPAARTLAVQFGTDRPRPFGAPLAGDGLINATPLGMAGQSGLCCDLAPMADGGWVIDMVTGDTPLLASARARGLAAIGGIELLVEQAADSFALLFGQRPPRDRDPELMLLLAR